MIRSRFLAGSFCALVVTSASPCLAGSWATYNGTNPYPGTAAPPVPAAYGSEATSATVSVTATTPNIQVVQSDPATGNWRNSAIFEKTFVWQPAFPLEDGTGTHTFTINAQGQIGPLTVTKSDNAFGWSQGNLQLAMALGSAGTVHTSSSLDGGYGVNRGERNNGSYATPPSYSPVLTNSVSYSYYTPQYMRIGGRMEAGAYARAMYDNAGGNASAITGTVSLGTPYIQTPTGP